MNRNTWLSVLILLGILAGIWALPAPRPVQAQDDAPTAILLTFEGPLNPSMLEYLNRGLRFAEQRQAELVILQLNTPGGSIDLMNDIVQTMRASQIPIVVYVAPRGAMAGSAGTVITLAGHASAMAPETAIGAASPVGSEGEDLGETLAAKEKNILKATVRSLSEHRSPEAVQLAEDTIENAQAASSTEAAQVGLVDFIANDTRDLLNQLDGFQVQTADGKHNLSTQNGVITEFNPTLIEEILNTLTNPNIVFLLLTIGVQAILIEISSPGGWVAGFIGVVSLALAIYGLGILPVNWFGLVFLAIAFVLFVLDVKAPTHGALTAAGVASLIAGALILFNSPGTPQFFRVSVPLVVGTSLVTAAVFFTIVSFALRAQLIPVRTGQESLMGRHGVARSEIKPDHPGTVQMGGELWTAEPAEAGDLIPPGARVEVVRTQGIRLYVRKINP